MSWWILATALWLGILTSISPCPLASNIAALSFVARHIGSPRRVLLSGALYTLGRTVAYVALGIVILGAFQWLAVSSGEVSRFCQRYLNQALGPVLILVGMLLLEMLPVSISLNLAGKGVQDKAARGTWLWAGPLGILFALSFCPVSAGLFFGGLLTLSAKTGSHVLLPTLFGVGTALPVIGLAFVIALAGQHVGKTFSCLTRIERWVRTVTGAVFILAGIYHALLYIYGLPLALWR